MISLAFFRKMFHVSSCGGIHCLLGEQMKNSSLRSFPSRYTSMRKHRSSSDHKMFSVKASIHDMTILTSSFVSFVLTFL